MNNGINKQTQVFINPASSEKRVDLASTEEKRIGRMGSELMPAYEATNTVAHAVTNTATHAPAHTAAYAATYTVVNTSDHTAVHTHASVAPNAVTYMPTHPTAYAPIPSALVSDEEFYEVFSEIRLP